MIKITKYLFIFLFLLSCGYSPIYQTNKEINLKLGTINYSGDKVIGREIAKGLEKFKKSNSLNILDANFDVTKKEIIVTKDKKGDPSSFRTTIEMNLELSYQKNNKVFTRNFIEERTYDSMENKFELTKYKNNLENNMIFKILGDINIFFNIIQNDL
ncbi:hypothetical protein [Candidatus Pelagibacter sp.]|uniref:hypothetical protein n=1 Tax=Candidatus Pelagibacter sp. TaxID=2024849 RepID=UPI003F86947F